MNASRIPEFSDTSYNGMMIWFATMFERGLLFHPDDVPEEIVSIDSGERTFSTAESLYLRKTVDIMFELHDDNVYEAAYPIFMKRMGIQLDA